MNTSGLVDVTAIDRLNVCLADALGVGVSFVPVTSDDNRLCFRSPVQNDIRRVSADNLSGSHGNHTIETAGSRSHSKWVPHGTAVEPGGIPLTVDGRLLGTWYVHGTSPRTNLREDGPEAASWDLDVAHAECASSCCLLERPPLDESAATAIISGVGRIISDAIMDRERLQTMLDRNADVALRKTVALSALERIVDTASVGLVEVDRNGEICWTNVRARRLLGMDDAEQWGDYAGDAPVISITSIDGAPSHEGYRLITRRLVHGETVRGIGCTGSRADGTVLELLVDASPEVSDNGRLNRVVLVLQTSRVQRGSTDAARPSWAEVGALLNVVNTRATTTRAEVTRRIGREMVDPLRAAWLEFDVLRRHLNGTSDAALVAHMDVLGNYLRQMSASSVGIAAACRPPVWDYQGIVSAVSATLQDCETKNGLDWSLTDRTNGEHSLDASRCTVLYQVADELISLTSETSSRLEITVDANEHYWLLVIDGFSLGARYCEGGAVHVDVRVREALKSLGGKIEVVRVNERHVIHYVILPTLQTAEDCRTGWRAW